MVLVVVVEIELVEVQFAVVSSLLPKYACYSGYLPEVSVLVDIFKAVTEISSTIAGNSSTSKAHSGMVVVDLSIVSTSGYLSLDWQQSEQHSQKSDSNV